MRHIAANVLTLLIVGLVLLFGAIVWMQNAYESPGPLSDPLLFEVRRAESMTSVVERLDAEGAITYPGIMRLGARYSGLDEGLKYGEYEIPAGASMDDILRLLNKGGNVFRQIVFPEGYTSWQVVQLLRENDELSGEITAIPAEGSLAPAGYDFQRGDDRQTLLDRMAARQIELLEKAWASRAEDLPLESPEEMLTLASIVEKETGVAEERPQVASVFVNRLRRGMRLQTDPTVIYGITNGQGSLGRGLRRSELVEQTPYNTYVIPGLPPTPIANPGADALAAVAQPAETDFLYFVADGSGGHVFATTLEEHNANVVQWRRIEAERAREAAEAEAEAGGMQ